MTQISDLNNLNEKEQAKKLTKQLTNIKTVEDLDFSSYKLIKEIVNYGKNYKKKLIKVLLSMLPFLAVGGLVIALPFLIGATGDALIYAIVMGGTVVATVSASYTMSVLYFSDKTLLKTYKQLKKAKCLEKLVTLTAEYEKSSKFEADKKAYKQQQLEKEYVEKNVKANACLDLAEGQITLLTKKLQQLREKQNGNSQAEFKNDALLNAYTQPVTLEALDKLEDVINDVQTLKSKLGQPTEQTETIADENITNN